MNLKNKEIIFLFFIEAFLFYLTLALGILCAKNLERILKIQRIEIPSFSPFEFVFYFFLATLFAFLIFRFLRERKIKGKIYKFLFLSVSFFSSLIFFESFLPEPVPLILVFLLIFWWIKNPIVLNQNLLIIFSLAGIGATLGLSLKPEAVILILIILSIYDFIAVYKTGHMIKLAREMMEAGAITALIIPPKISGFSFSLNKVKPGSDFLILGGGDVALPLIFCASLIPLGILKSLIVSIFSLFGLFFNFFIFIKQKVRKPMPALPLITLSSIMGYGLSQFIK
jgi:presenilin-like A22 family membrane protease